MTFKTGDYADEVEDRTVIGDNDEVYHVKTTNLKPGTTTVKSEALKESIAQEKTGPHSPKMGL